MPLQFFEQRFGGITPGALPRVAFRLGLLIIGFALAPEAFGQHSPYRVDHWTTDNGLPQNTVRSIVQTRDGYLWLTTFDGLARFDGVRFSVFDKSNTPAITNNRMTALYEDRDGTLWIGADQGELVAYRNGVFTSYATSERLRGVPIGFGLDLNDEMLIIAGPEAFYIRAGELIAAPSEYSNKKLKLYRGSSGVQWTIDGRGVREVKDGVVMNYSLSFDWNGSVSDMQPYEDRQGYLWVGDGSSVYRLRDGQTTRYTERDGLPLRSILSPHCEDNDGGVWFATAIGVVRFQNGRFIVYGNDAGLPTMPYYQLIKDREGSIWVASLSGLYRLRSGLVTTYSTANGLPHNEVYPLLKARNGDIWIGTVDGLSLFRNGAVAKHPLNSLKVAVQSLLEDAAGRIWIGTYGGLLRYENGIVQNFSVGEAVYDVKSDREGTVWVASALGLFKLDGDKIVARYTTEDGLPGDDVKLIYQDRRGTLWFGTYGGLAQLKDGKFIAYTAADGLAGNRVRTIYEDSDGTLWIGTYDDGLSRFRDGKFFNYRTEEGLFNNGVFQILEDRRGYFWISCNKGIYRVSRHELSEMAEGRLSRINCVAFGKDDGMLNSECNGGRQPAGLVGDDGRMWFPTMGGVAVIDPEAAQANPQPPPVMIESVTLERDRVDFRRRVAIDPGHGDLEINYTGLSFIKSEQTRFKYKLEGLNDDWVDVGTRRAVYFPYLPPGNYTFRVIAANSDGVWNVAGASLEIFVATPFYRASWFIALVMLSVAGIALLVYRRRVAALKARHAAQEAFSRQLMESQEGERKRIAAELHDSLGQRLLVIKNWVTLSLMNLPEHLQAREQLNEISENASLALKETRQIVFDLRPYQLDKIGLTSTLNYTVEQIAVSSGIGLTARIAELDGAFSPADEIVFYRIVQECLNNIVKHSGATQARVLITRDSAIRLEVTDNGRGFAVDKLDQKKQGFGLSGIAERARMLGGDFRIDSEAGGGTTISIMIDRISQATGKHE
jgi:signal transduction histidine kinase/ligand-binding sensor domain-containing protein